MSTSERRDGSDGSAPGSETDESRRVDIIFSQYLQESIALVRAAEPASPAKSIRDLTLRSRVETARDGA